MERRLTLMVLVVWIQITTHCLWCLISNLINVALRFMQYITETIDR